VSDRRDILAKAWVGGRTSWKLVPTVAPAALVGLPWLILLAQLLCLPTFAANVDLSTVPKRDTVQLTIYNSEDITLVRETRAVTFKKGLNGLQFSWANTLIDPTSVELKFLTNPDKFEVVDTTFPRAKPQMLYWNVQSDIDGQATVQITYFTSGITWSADYICIADKDEKQMGLDGFVRVFNRSGEEYENAQVRLVVGKINLVQKIAELARIPMADVEGLKELEKSELRREVLKDSFDQMPANLPAPVVASAPSKLSRKASASTSSTRSRARKP
jgi:hypothetical protein